MIYYLGLPLSFQLSLFELFGFRKKRRTRRKGSSVRKAAPGRLAPQTSDVGLLSIWSDLQTRYFPHRTDLLEYHIRWSKRVQKRTLASCAIEKKIITVAQELRYEQHACWLEPLIYHEMCHAVLGHHVGNLRGKKQWHGKDFRALERQHPHIQALDSWIRSGGWLSAVRSHRAKLAHARRKSLL